MKVLLEYFFFNLVGNQNSHQNLHVAVQQQQQLLQQIQQSNQIKAVVAAAAQQHLVAAAANQRRATVLPSNTPVPSVNANPQQQIPRNAQVQQNVAAKVTTPSVSTLPPNVLPSALFRGPPPSVTPGQCCAFLFSVHLIFKYVFLSEGLPHDLIII